MFDEILLGNFEGLLVVALTFMIFKKYFELEKINQEKIGSIKRIGAGLVYIAYYILTVYFLFFQARRKMDSEPLSLTWKIYCAYFVFSNYVFVAWPMFKIQTKNTKQ